jgi:hypothetical protein
LHEIRNEHHVYKITPVGAVLASWFLWPHNNLLPSI